MTLDFSPLIERVLAGVLGNAALFLIAQTLENPVIPKKPSMAKA